VRSTTLYGNDNFCRKNQKKAGSVGEILTISEPYITVIIALDLLANLGDFRLRALFGH
jgi:hypothetical protein